MNLTCCCCGAVAPAFEHWHNRDTGFGLCGDCATIIQSRPDADPDQFRRDYGARGIHWMPPVHPPTPLRALSAAPRTR